MLSLTEKLNLPTVRLEEKPHSFKPFRPPPGSEASEIMLIPGNQSVTLHAQTVRKERQYCSAIYDLPLHKRSYRVTFTFTSNSPSPYSSLPSTLHDYCTGPAVGVCASPYVPLFTNAHRLLGEETQHDLVQMLSNPRILAQIPGSRDQKLESCTALFYLTGAVRTGDTVILPNGEQHSYHTNQHKPVNPGSNFNLSKPQYSRSVTLLLNMEKRTLQFLADEKTLPVEITSLPYEVYAGVSSSSSSYYYYY